MPENNEKQIQEKMLAIAKLIEQGKESKETQVGEISYYKDFVFQEIKIEGMRTLGENEIYVAKVENTSEGISTYEIYSGITNSLIATVNEQGKLRFMPEYIENIRQADPIMAEELNSQEWDFELPQELGKQDRILTKEERERIRTKEEKTSKESLNKEQGEKEQERQEQEEQNEEEEEKGKDQEEKQKEEIAKAKNIPSNNILIVKENSNLYKDHPNLEPNLYFYRDNRGVVKAEYIDENGKYKPSKYFEDSTTSLRQETVSLGDDGKPVTKEVPYQVMKTKGLSNVDKDIRDVRMTIDIDTYGYLEISESRQGQNGEWLSHDIEVKGRDYNSHTVNETTSTRTGKADPDKQTNAYEKTENTGLAKDGIDYSEMYLIEHTSEVIDELIKEGYQEPEAIKIVDYVIGEEKLTFKQAKEKVNREIGKEQTKEESKEDEGKQLQSDEDEGRTPWGDAEERERRARG